MANGPQILKTKQNEMKQNKNILSVISIQGPFKQTAFWVEAHTELPTSVLNYLPQLFLPSEPGLIKEFLESCINQ